MDFIDTDLGDEGVLLRVRGKKTTRYSSFFLIFPQQLFLISLKPIEEVVEVRDALLETLALTDTSDDGGALAASLEWITRDDLPVVEHALREGLTLGLSTKIIIETE